MGKFEEAFEAVKKQCKTQRIKADEKLLEKIAKSLGPSLYNRDARTVATGQKHELETIKKNYLVKKLGCKADDTKLDKAMQKAIDKIGRSNRNKLRPVFYYLLVKELGKESKIK